MMEVWPGSLRHINLVEPSQSTQRAGLSLVKDLSELPRIESYDRLQLLAETINRKKSGRKHNLVIAVLVEPGTPQGSKIISQMRSHILWMEKRCPHDGPCPLLNTGKYCHFVQHMERTPSQRIHKRSSSRGPLRGFEDEKFSYVAFRRGTRPRESWPLDGMKFETLKEMKANRIYTRKL